MKKELKVTNELIDSILSNVNVGKKNSCWEWTLRAAYPSGRPTYSIDRMVEGKRKTVSFSPQRLMLEKHLGHEIDARTVDVTCGNLMCCNPAHLSPRTFENRFWNNVEKDENGCWNWKGTIAKNTGYGVIQLDKTPRLTHRLSYELSHGEVPDGLMVLHKCNNKLCINPKHLYAGTHNDNMRDMANADTLKGEKNPNVVLTEDDAREIKKLVKSRKVYYRDIAQRFGISRQAVKDIALGRTWSWLE